MQSDDDYIVDTSEEFSQEWRPPQKAEPKPQHKPLKLVEDRPRNKKEALERLKALFNSGKLNNSTFGE